MDCYVYIVKCKDQSYYSGISWNPYIREKQHNKEIKTPLQKSKRPVKLVYIEKYKLRILAAKREKEIKGWRREKKINLINSNSLH